MKNSKSAKIIDQHEGSQVAPIKNYQHISFIDSKKGPYFCKTFKKKNNATKCIYLITPKNEHHFSKEKNYKTKSLAAKFGKRLILDEYLTESNTLEKENSTLYHSRINTEPYNRHNYQIKEIKNIKDIKDKKYNFQKIKELNKNNLFHNAVKICDKKKLMLNKDCGKIKNPKYSKNTYSAAKLENNKFHFCDDKTFNKYKNLNRNVSSTSLVDTYTNSTKNGNYIITVTTKITGIPYLQDTDEGVHIETIVRYPHINDNKKIYHKNCLSEFNNFENRIEKNNIKIIKQVNCPIHGKSTWTYKKID